MKVSVLMSTYNGEKYLREQIDSILNQREVSLKLIVRDDGSSDKTKDILDEYQKLSKLRWYTGENMRPARSFWDLLSRIGDTEFYAFSDQDDVWYVDKLASAIQMMKEYSNRPCLYFSEKRLVDKDCKFISDTRGNYKLTLGEAMVYNPATGCTMVLNKALRDILISATPELPSLHDSWIYRTCLAVGGKVIYDVEPHIMYRQHGNNVVGHAGACSRIKSFVKSILSKKNSSARSCTAKELLRCYRPYISADVCGLLVLLSEYNTSLIKKLKLISNPQMRPASFIGRCTFLLYIMFNKY